ncbi:hypothetical protein AaE_009135 [Aphanomyces astaci]|uniref:Uncharacterized protein n=1 Tax=Aphanomyces astaci TaxID=112090 RepID=A0A6A5A5K4_APHAT|nr:hypothetical protein AaE_009135 [Aphanomyces astaci]
MIGDRRQGPNECYDTGNSPVSILPLPLTPALPDDADVATHPSTGGDWSPPGPQRLQVSEPTYLPGPVAPSRTTQLPPSMPPTPSSLPVEFEYGNLDLPVASADLEFQPISNRDLGNSEFNQPIRNFHVGRLQPIGDQNAAIIPGISPLANATEVQPTPPVLSGPAASSGANRSPLDYTKVIRGFSAAAKQHTKAAFVPPPADAIEAILLELSKPKKDRVDILAKIDLARPYTPKVAIARFTVDTGDALATQSHKAIIMSSLFASAQTDTAKLLLSEFVQVTGGIMEHPLDSLCFMDITGIRDNFDATQFYRKLTELGVDVVYHSHRAVIPGTGCHTNTWRVYFTDAAIPAQLQINGEPMNQI